MAVNLDQIRADRKNGVIVSQQTWDALVAYASELEYSLQLNLYGEIDFSLKAGDVVYQERWWEGKRQLEVVDVNWALRSAALRLATDGGIVIWPVVGLRRQPFGDPC